MKINLSSEQILLILDCLGIAEDEVRSLNNEGQIDELGKTIRQQAGIEPEPEPVVLTEE